MNKQWNASQEHWIPYLEMFSKGFGLRRKILTLSGIQSEFILKLRTHNHEVTEGDFHPSKGLPYHHGTFDIVDGGWFFKSGIDSSFFLEECNRILRPSGVLYLAFWNSDSWSVKLTDSLVQDSQLPSGSISSFRELSRMNGFFMEVIHGAASVAHKYPKLKIIDKLAKIAPELSDVVTVKLRRIDQ